MRSNVITVHYIAIQVLWYSLETCTMENSSIFTIILIQGAQIGHCSRMCQLDNERMSPIALWNITDSMAVMPCCG